MSGRIAESDADLLARNDGELVNVMIKLDVDAVATYTGGVNGLQPTSPSVTGKSLKENGAAVAAYTRYLGEAAAVAQRAIKGAVPAAQFGRTFTVAFGGIAARLPANQARKLVGVRGVSAVMYDTIEQLLTDATPEFIGADQVWPSIGGSQRAGQGVKVGILDTGIWPEHPSFTDPGINHPGGTYGCEFGLSGEPNDPAFACNDKLIGAYAFLDTNLANSGPGLPGEYCTAPANCSARDSDGHGTHTASTAAGRRLATAVLFGVDRGPISGMAPGAHVIAFRVCDNDGCYSSDSVSAVEQAITDDVDVLNFSISGGSDPYSDSVELAFLDAYAAGIAVNASAGNSGPGAATANHGGPWVTTVGASTSDRHFVTTLHLTADGGATLNIEGVTITAGINSPTPVVLASAPPYSDEQCLDPAAPGTFTGKIVVCERGMIARVEKGYNVLQGGAAGMILYNVANTDVETDNHYLPTVHLNDPTETINAFVSGNTGVEGWWNTGVPTAVQGDVMASFSSRGPLGDFLKPDVTAPGIQILAGNSPEHLDDPAGGLGPDGELFQAIAGTSMSSPHAAGVSALLKAAHPGWTPGEIKSAMMTASTQAVLKEDGVTPADPFDRGAGSIRANQAVKPTVAFDVNPVDYYAAAGDEDSRIDLNLPSINAPNMPGIIQTWRTARNMSPVSQTLDITATKPAGSTITLTPSTLTIPAWSTRSFFIEINGTKLNDGQYFGQITLNPRASGYRNAVLPVAFDKGPGEVTLDNSCASGTVARGSEVDCQVTVTNLASETANVSVRVKGPRGRQVVVNDWSAGNKKGNGFIWNGQLTPALAPQILSLTTPGYGYLSLSRLGASPQPGFGDESLINYGVPAFNYAGELYSSVGVDSNGYVIVGGASSAADNNCCNPAMPTPTPPNNVLAPYWTDLDPGAGGAMFVNLVSGGGAQYIVVEWDQVPIFGTAIPRTAQLWIQTAASEGATGIDEEITFEYCISRNNATAPDGCNGAHPNPTPIGPGASDGLVVGAENRDGSDAATIGPINTQPLEQGYIVNTGDPTAGGSMTITYDALGVSKGRYKILATMVSDITQGTATDLFWLKVTP